MELGVQLSVCFYRAAVHFGSQFRWVMKVLASTLVATVLAGSAVAQIPPTDRRMIPPRSIQLSAQQGYVIKENLQDMNIKQVPRRKEIGIGNKVPRYRTARLSALRAGESAKSENV